jgi:spoIIIJ-associated protein
VTESIEVNAKNVNDAIAQALQRLGKKQEEVDIEILSEGSRGILGIGAEDARIRVTPKPPAEKPKPAPSPSRPPAPKPAAVVEEEPKREKQQAQTRTVPVEIQSVDGVPDEVVQTAKQVVEELLRLMGLNALVTMRGLEPRGSRSPDDGTPTCTADVTGDDLGILIGRRGENLAALQYVTNLIVSRKAESDVRVVVDVEHYLVRRYESLRGLALRMGERVKLSGAPITLEPMPPHERRIVHLTLADEPGVSTVSIGEGDERRVVISPRK